jgi:hypothetical protein
MSSTFRAPIVCEYPNPDKPERIATKAQTETVYYNLISCLGVLVAKYFVRQILRKHDAILIDRH